MWGEEGAAHADIYSVADVDCDINATSLKLASVLSISTRPYYSSAKT